MAADILAYSPKVVPVGEDQRQHLELTRNIAERFNSRFGDVLTVPEAIVPPEGARIMDLRHPDRKMSKSSQSAGGTIYILDGPDDIKAKISGAVTDSHRSIAYSPDIQPGISNLVSILAAATASTSESVLQTYGDSSYSDLKIAVADAVIERLTPVRQRFSSLLADQASLHQVLEQGATAAEAVAGGLLSEVRQAMGFVAP